MPKGNRTKARCITIVIYVLVAQVALETTYILLLYSCKRAVALIGATDVELEVAATAAARRHGLSHRGLLQTNRGMIFLYRPARLAKFWMTDMQFPLDIVFLRDGIIRCIAQDLQPDIDPRLPRAYECSQESTEVIELPGGFARQHSVAIGQVVSLNLPPEFALQLVYFGDKLLGKFGLNN